MDDLALLTISEAARQSGLSRDTVRRLIEAGDWPVVEMPGGTRRIPRQAVVAWIERASARTGTGA